MNILDGQKRHANQRGFTLPLALIAVVIMTMISLSLAKSVESGNTSAASIAFKQATSSSGEYGIDLAMQWLNTNSTSLNNDATAGAGYYATGTNPNFATQVDWTGGTSGSLRHSSSPVTDPHGNSVSFIIQRLCSATGAFGVGTIQCSTAQVTVSGGQSQVGVSYGTQSFSNSSQIFYQITVRATSSNGSVGYSQALVALPT